MDIKEVEDQILKLYKEIMNKYQEEGLNNRVDSATYYQDLILVRAKNSNLGIDGGAYVFKIIDELEKPIYQIYDGDMLIAEIDETGKMRFTKDYYKKYDPKRLLEKGIDLEEIDRLDAENFEIPEELREGKDKRFFAEQLEEMEDRRREEESSRVSRESEARQKEGNIEKADTEAEKAEEIAKTMGIDPKGIAKTTKIVPTQYVTRTETFESFLGISGKYKEIYAAKFNVNVDQNSKFAFVGVKTDGTYEIIDATRVLQPNRGKEIYDVTLDGDVTTQETPTELFMLPGSKGDRLVSMTIGNHGNLEVDCVVWDKTQNEYIAIDVRDQFTDERPDPTTMRELDPNIRDRRHIAKVANTMRAEISAKGEAYDIETIDGNDNNLRGFFTPTTVVAVDGQETTLGDLAEQYGIEFNKYARMIEDASKDRETGEKYLTIEERVAYVNTKIAADKTIQKEDGYEPKDPGERSLEDDALNRINRH